jgi:hypothetical protein
MAGNASRLVISISASVDSARSVAQRLAILRGRLSHLSSPQTLTMSVEARKGVDWNRIWHCRSARVLDNQQL